MTQSQPETKQLGPYRVIGMSVVDKDSSAFKALWEQFIQRIGEIEQAGDGQFFGLCRCWPGATDGTFEYVAGVSA